LKKEGYLIATVMPAQADIQQQPNSLSASRDIGRRRVTTSFSTPGERPVKKGPSRSVCS
jgi:hypothetical protein